MSLKSDSFPSYGTSSDDSKNIKKTDLDLIESTIGNFGTWQCQISFLLSLLKFPMAWIQLSIVFLAPPTEFWCRQPEEFKNLTLGKWKQITSVQPTNNTVNTEKKISHCNKTMKCPWGYEYNRSQFASTIITEWNLVCNRAHLVELTQVALMFGVLLGSIIIGLSADKYGRRKILLTSIILQTLFGFLTAGVPWFGIFTITRFLLGFANGGVMVVSFVLCMEIVGGTKWRTAVGIMYQVPFNLGHLSLALIGYLIRDWHYISLAVTLPSIILLSYYWIIPESPRWLLAVGQTDRAIKVMKKAAHHNHLPTETIKDDVSNYLEKGPPIEPKKGELLDLVRTSNMRIKTFCVCFNWVVCGLCFFGGAQYIGQLGGNIFLNVAMSAVIQVPGTCMSIWLTKTIGRRYTLMGANILAGLSFVCISLVPHDLDWPKILLGSSGMFGLSLCFPTVYIYSGELYPTVIRNIGVGTSSMCARIGSMLAPYVAGLALIEPWMPPIIFGVIPLIGAALCYHLPETLDCKLPETLEDAELFGKKIRDENKKSHNVLELK
ncbi:hypothetical protein FQR65_LT09219 [Abscondita terminalis]|nr:hypothetical protein FQR65_LT09219 [Abscondita terminalis]